MCSIDESFIGLDGARGDLSARARQVRARINQWVSIPCGIGIAPTKTLTKLANYIAKTAERKLGSYPDVLAQVCNLSTLPASELDVVLAATDVGEVWGVGRRIAAQLKGGGINTVLDLARLDPATVRSCWSERCANCRTCHASISMTHRQPKKKLPAPDHSAVR